MNRTGTDNNNKIFEILHRAGGSMYKSAAKAKAVSILFLFLHRPGEGTFSYILTQMSEREGVIKYSYNRLLPRIHHGHGWHANRREEKIKLGYQSRESFSSSTDFTLSLISFFGEAYNATFS